MPKAKSGQAFPRSPEQFEGLTLRDYFAGQALAGASASGALDLAEALDEEEVEALALACYALADAMLRVRDQE